MKFHEVCLGIEHNQITFDYAGHTCNDVKQRFLDAYKTALNFANGINIREEESTQDIRKIYQDILNREVIPSQHFGSCFLFEEVFCFHCGEKLRFVLEDNVLALRNRYVHDPNARFGMREENYPKEYRCAWEKPRPFYGEINVEKALVFANYFDFPDTSEGNEYNSEWNLNCIAGRYRRAEYKYKNYNVAYGQMSNMSIGIYLHKRKDSVIIGPAYHPVELMDNSHLTDEEYEIIINKPVFEEYDLVGTICLDVWRWEATDYKLTIKPVNDNFIKTDVKPGIWKFEHYFDYLRDNDGNNHVYAKLWLST